MRDAADYVLTGAGRRELTTPRVPAHRALKVTRAGEPVRSFEKRERPYRSMTADELWSAFVTCAQLIEISGAAEDPPVDTVVAWTGREVTPPSFAEHMRQELVPYRWDITGDDATSTGSLNEPWLTDHSVNDVGRPLLVRGRASLDIGPARRVEGRLRAREPTASWSPPMRKDAAWNSLQQMDYRPSRAIRPSGRCSCGAAAPRTLRGGAARRDPRS